MPADPTMIVGAGVDVCAIDRIERALGGRAGPRFRDRTFTAGEIAYCERRRRTRMQSYAATFAAKEAVLKALGTGWAEGLGWHDVEVVRTERGTPTVVLHGAARTRARRTGVVQTHLTLAHDGGLAVAVVVLGGRLRPRGRRGRGAAAGAKGPRRQSRRRSR